MRAVNGLLVTVSMVLAIACGAQRPASESPAAEPPALTFEELSVAEAAAQAAAHYQTLRFNPAADACGCPDFEVRIAERWWRLRTYARALAEEDLEALRTHLAERTRGGDVRHVYATGDLDDDLVVVCPNGAYGFEMRLDAVSDTPPPPPITD